MTNNQYYIIPISALSILDCADIVGDSRNLRKNINETSFVVKTKVEIIDCEHLKSYIPYSHSEILAIMDTTEWGVINAL
jgi:hypothetical protein